MPIQYVTANKGQRSGYPLSKKTLSIRKEHGDIQWIKKIIHFHNKRHPKDMVEKEISQYISYLATDKKVASNTQNQALTAIVFLYRRVLKIELGDFGEMERARIPEKLPVSAFAPVPSSSLPLTNTLIAYLTGLLEQ